MIEVKEGQGVYAEEKNAIVRFHNITKIYSGTVALRNINIDVNRAEIHGIIGKNGAGKTTLVGIMSGIVHPTEGEIIVGNKKYKSLSRIRARKEGISIVTQEPQVIPDWSVAENLFTPDFICHRNKQTIDWKRLYLEAEQTLEENQLNINSREKARDLTISEQQLLLVIKACYVDDARIIILDEVSTSLSKKDEDNLYRIIEEQKQKGKAILFISHRMDEILKVCDRVTVLRDGTVMDAEERCNLNKNKLSSFIIGEGYEEKGDKYLLKPREKERFQERLLSIDHFTKEGVFHDITFSLRKGEILGLAGLRGSGRTEIFKAIVGIDPPDEDSWIKIREEKKRFTSPAQAIKCGIAYVPEDRDKEGIIDILSVMYNLSLASLSSFHSLTRAGLINKKRELKLAENLIKMLSIVTPSPTEEVKNLSGGNRQKVMLGKIIATKPSIYLLDEPTKGIDIAAKKDLLKIIEDELIKSAGVILTSPGLEELMLICDRILIVYKGRITGEFFRGEFKEADLYLAMQGLGNEEITEQK